MFNLSRRRCLMLPFALAAESLGCDAPAAPIVEPPPEPPHRLTQEALLLAVAHLAEGVRGSGDQVVVETIRETLAAAAPFLRAPRLPARGTHTSTLFQGPRLFVQRFELAPGQRIEAHDHDGYHGVFKVVQGEISIDNFAFVDARARSLPASGELTLSPRGRSVLGEGDTAALCSDEASVHELTTRTGAVFVDFFLIHHPPPRSRRLSIGREALASGDVRARWRDG